MSRGKLAPVVAMPGPTQIPGDQHHVVIGLSIFGSAGLSRIFSSVKSGRRPPGFAAAQNNPELFGTACPSICHSEERYRLIFETSVDSIAINRVGDGTYFDCNRAFLDTLGYSREELLGRTSWNWASGPMRTTEQGWSRR